MREGKQRKVGSPGRLPHLPEPGNRRRFPSSGPPWSPLAGKTSRFAPAPGRDGRSQPGAGVVRGTRSVWRPGFSAGQFFPWSAVGSSCASRCIFRTWIGSLSPGSGSLCRARDAWPRPALLGLRGVVCPCAPTFGPFSGRTVGVPASWLRLPLRLVQGEAMPAGPCVWLCVVSCSPLALPWWAAFRPRCSVSAKVG